MELADVLKLIGWHNCYGPATTDFRHWGKQQINDVLAGFAELDPELVLVDEAWIGEGIAVALVSLSSSHPSVAGRGTPHYNVGPTAEGANRIGNLVVATKMPGHRVVWDEYHQKKTMAEVISVPRPERYHLIYAVHFNILPRRAPMAGTHGYAGKVTEASVWWRKPDGEVVKFTDFSGTFAVLE